MFDITRLYDRIIKKLEKYKKKSHVIKLEELKGAGSTGGEILSMTGKYLKDLKRMDNETYRIIRFKIVCYLFYCRMNGLQII